MDTQLTSGRSCRSSSSHIIAHKNSQARGQWQRYGIVKEGLLVGMTLVMRLSGKSLLQGTVDHTTDDHL